MKVVFVWEENFNTIEEEFEFPDDMEDDEIQKEYEIWLFEQIGDRTGWYIKEE